MSYLERRRALLGTALAAVAAKRGALQAELAGVAGQGLTEAQREARARELADALLIETRRAEVLTQEVGRLDAARPRDVADRAFELALAAFLSPLRLPGGTDTLLALLAEDPALRAAERPPPLTAEEAAALVRLAEDRAAREGRPLGSLDMPAIRTAIARESDLEDLAGAAHAAWLAQAEGVRPVLERDVAVLLPLRIETLFLQPDLPEDERWEMWLRIIPDEASIRRDDPVAKPAEIARLRAMWRAIEADLTAAERARPPEEWLETPRGRLEWERFAHQVGAGRAAWLIAACPPILDGGGGPIRVDAAVLGTTVAPNRIGGVPREIETWIAFGTDAPVRVDTTVVDAAALVFDLVGARPAGPDTTDLVHERDRWWVSWSAAKAVGLGRVVRLPGGRTPEDIATIYVVGVGEENPAAHFQGQVDAGEMAVLPLGAPTNAVDGTQAADIGENAAPWRAVARRRLRRRLDGIAEETELSRSLAGLGAELPAMPEPAEDDLRGLDGRLVGALWPVLWGHQLRDLWGCVGLADRLGGWARLHLRPEGPLPPIRIDRQPYGLLPTTALRRWQVAPEEGPDAAELEPQLVPGLRTMRAHWAAAARGEGTAVGADTARLLALIGRDALSPGYAHRLFLSVELWRALFQGLGSFDQAAFDAWLHETFAPLHGLVRGDPAKLRHHAGAGLAEELAIPLILPRHWPHWYYRLDDLGQPLLDQRGEAVPAMSAEEGFGRLLETLAQFGHRVDLLVEQWRGVLPDSLLVRLLLQAGLLSAAAVAEVNGGAGPETPIREPILGDGALPTRIEALDQQYAPDGPHDHPAGAVRGAVVDAILGLAKAVGTARPEAAPRILTALDRAFRATLDTATHRIDPWIIGMAGRRLAHLRNRPDTTFRLGVYGWVDGPILGAPGPTDGGLIHAPSYEQALTAAILRDKDITERLETPAPADGRHLWSMQLESRRIRAADRLAEEVRIGAHVFEALGREVERIVGVRTPVGAVVEATSRVDALRRAYPIRKDQPDIGRVCHGPDALAGLLGGGVAPLTVTAEQREALEELRSVLDTYGDLLVAEAVHQVVSGHADRAGAAMDAAAGLGQPPTLAFLETPLAAEGLTSAAIAVLPDRPAVGADAGAAPALLADAAVAAALESLAGGADLWSFEGVATGGETRRTSLAALNLLPADALVLPFGLLEELARALLGLDEAAPLSGGARHRHALAGRVARALGSGPALLRDLVSAAEPGGSAVQPGPVDEGVLAELRGRYAALHESAVLLADELRDAAAEGAAASAARQALFRALRWGIAPVDGNGKPRALSLLVTRGILPDDPAVLPHLVARAEAAIRERLGRAPAPGGALDQPAGAIGALAASGGGGQLPVLGRIPLEALLAASRLRIDAADAALDQEWLTVMAAVRPPLAAVEALQLEAALGTDADAAPFPGVTVWSNAPGDPWQVQALAALRQRRLEAGGDDPRLALPRFVAAYTAGGDAWQGEGAAVKVAVGLIDSWSEAVPRPNQRTTAVFGFNAPAARAPQAILIAVPPDPTTTSGSEFDAASLIEILQDTRELAHARAAGAERLGAWRSVVPTAMLNATGRTGIRLDPGTDFPS